MPTTPFDLDPAEMLRHDRWLRALARSLVHGADVDDLVQDTWAAALRRRPDTERSLRGWLGTVVRRLAARRLRTARRQGDREREVARDEPFESTAETVAVLELQRRVSAAVSAMAEPYRSAVLLRYFHGLEYREIAAREGVNEVAARKRVARGLDALRERLRRADPDWREAPAMVALAGGGVGSGGTGLAGGLVMAQGMRVTAATAMLLMLGGIGVAVWWVGNLETRGVADETTRAASAAPAVGAGETPATSPDRSTDGDRRRVGVAASNRPDAVQLEVLADPGLPLAVVATKDGEDLVVSRRDAGTRWSIGCATDAASLAALQITLDVGPAVTVTLTEVTDPRLVVDLRNLRTNSVELLGRPAGQTWLCCIQAESDTGEILYRDDHPLGDVSGAQGTMTAHVANLDELTADRIEFPAPIGQRWAIDGSVDGYRLDPQKHVGTPSATTLEVLGPKNGITVQGDFPAGTVPQLHPAGDRSRKTAFTAAKHDRVLHLWSGPGPWRIAADTDYVLRCITPAGVVFQQTIHTDSTGNASVVFGDTGIPPWTFGVPKGVRVRRIMLCGGDHWFDAPAPRDGMYADSGTGPTADRVWIASDHGDWNLGYAFASNDDVAELRPQPDRSVAVRWIHATHARLDPRAVERFEGEVHWWLEFQARAPDGTPTWHWFANGDLAADPTAALVALRLPRYGTELRTRLQVREKTGDRWGDAIELTYALR